MYTSIGKLKKIYMNILNKKTLFLNKHFLFNESFNMNFQKKIIKRYRVTVCNADHECESSQ